MPVPLNSKTNNRKAAEAAGRAAEARAALWLQLKGYRILARRYRGRGGEIDLIAAKPLWGPPKLIAFIEVKQRADEKALADAITARQRERIIMAANHFLACHPHFASATLRYDGMFTGGGGLPEHKRNLWFAAN